MEQLLDHVRPQAATKWYDLGVKLLDGTDILDVIQYNHSFQAEACCTEMFKTWLKKDTDASWSKLANALRAPSVKLYVLADTIEKQFAGKAVKTHIVIAILLCNNCRCNTRRQWTDA